MSVRLAVIFLLLVNWFHVAHAEDPPAPTETSPAPSPAPTPTPPTTAAAPPLSGPTASATIVTGRVTDVLGRPVPDVRVYVLPKRGTPYRLKTDKHGRYSAEVSAAGIYGVVVAIGKMHTYRTVLAKEGIANTLDIEAELDSKGGEVIRIDDQKRPQPKVKPQAKHDEQQTLPYTEEAVERDAWARAWLLLDVDESGRVTRLKLVKPPGFGLERICLDEAFKLRFAPALDDAGRPMKNYMLWTMEWPSWGWLVRGNGTSLRRPPATREVHHFTQSITIRGSQDGAAIGGAWASPLPVTSAFANELSRVPCWGHAPLNLDLQNRAFRDCSKPDMSLAKTLPWVTRETIATAVSELATTAKLVAAEQKALPRPSRVPGYIGIGLTSALAVGSVLSFARYDDYHSRLVKHGMIFVGNYDPERIKADEHARDRWKKISIGMSAATILIGGATLYLWNRKEPNFSIAPNSSGTGASATYTRSW
jgi:hypothetical protein